MVLVAIIFEYGKILLVLWCSFIILSIIFMKNSKNNFYEVMVILKPLLPDDARKAFHKSVMDLCLKLDGKVEDTDIWGKRYLAYKISVYQEGYYILYTIALPSSSLKEFKRQMDLKQEIIRYLLVKIDEGDIQRKSIKKKQMDVNI